MIDKNVSCEGCGRFLFKAHGTCIQTIVCPDSRCKYVNQIKIVSSNKSHDIRYKFAKEQI